ncbi:sulfite exporter TauE/SafE family protein [Streptococcus chenjunshii]|uniref:Probable membrane transporter protein n=1 Tax=Streptococcus chenjunshii TaxID=2173853 RepID=A0A372KKB8_9STRE|nr:sulfite exporter TauE/SafE family protein [Streptococcus chenjunshii]AXQ77753.1 sulfite exporter TauE/SafE family protein [Streptococcus chenjunshii]RFU50475.1 sulfite exporter TauE/SafE family protein [Streptococcus chenjunshii]RFU52703.1 sulfite exporter TauE/SafE family protein [Streptococcus chenjunshii]
MEIILYTLIVLFATAIGATSGAGGGAIIKPLFDLIGIDNATVIGIYATIAVFAMCLSSIYRHAKNGVTFDKKVLFGLSIGSVIGGILGEMVFKRLTQAVSNHTVTLVQSIMLFIVLLSVLVFTQFRERLPKYRLMHFPTIVVVGMLIGALSVFLGIGGGPLNIIALVGMMSYTTKESAPYSIAMIFFAQISKVIKLVAAAPPENFRWILVPLIVVAAILGGHLGTIINHRSTDKQVNRIYAVLMTGLLIVCFYNIISNL